MYIFVSNLTAIFNHMTPSKFEQNISSLNFSFLKTSKESGILLTDNYLNIDATVMSPDVLFALETAKDKFGADAVYFRYFEDGRSLVPQLYLFDATTHNLTSEQRRKVQINMWNGGQAPAYIIVERTSISIFDSRKKPDSNSDSQLEALLKVTADAFTAFESEKFDNGLFWEKFGEKDSFKFEQSAVKGLISGLKNVYIDFQEKSGLDKHVALRLLVQSLLVKYLEERDEESQSGYFAKTYFKRHFQCNNFCEAIRKGRLLDLLDQLAKDFNGKVFEWNISTDIEARNAIQRTEVNQLANYLDANIENNQFVLWPLYSFSHLPVEIISSVYEELLTNSKDIVYTPEMIVSTLVDECMPVNQSQDGFKLIDVSCGSGIFLVKAYKRLVQWWRYEQWKRTGKLVKPSLAVLKDLLLKNVYGIDIEQDAIRLSIFSLALAILDEVDLDPPTWGKLQFPNLENNIICRDFFQHITMTDKPQNFDLVIGNPPFNLQLEDGKEPKKKDYFARLKEKFGYSNEIRIPDDNIALHFLVQSMTILKPNGLLCMIQPSAPLLYQKDVAFKTELFGKYNALQVIDFTNLSDKIWGRKNVATVALFLQNTIPDNQNILHLIAGRTFANKNRLFLEFDHYDFHMIDKDSAINNIYAWKANLLGGGRVFNLSNRLSLIRSIGNMLDEKISMGSGWAKGEGFIRGRNYSLDYITNKNYLPVNNFTESEGINSSNIVKCEFKSFHRRTNPILFEPPHLLIRKVKGKYGLISQYNDEYLTFNSSIFAIHAPTNDKDELQRIDAFLKQNKKILLFYILATSSRVGIIRDSSLYDEDILGLPYPLDLSDITLSKAEQIVVDDAIKYQLGNKMEILYKSFSSHNDIKDFAAVFCESLNNVYKTDITQFNLSKVIDAGDYYVVQIEYNKIQSNICEFVSKPSLREYINILCPFSRDSLHMHVQKIMKLYLSNTIILIKPKQIKYWLRSVALRDADEVFAEFIKTDRNA